MSLSLMATANGGFTGSDWAVQTAHAAESRKITDIGESRYAHITGSKVLAMGDTGLNITKEYGEGVDIRTAVRFRDASAMTQVTGANGTEFYRNFEPTGYYTSDWRIEHTIWLPFYSVADANTYKTNNGGDSLIYTSASDPHPPIALTGEAGVGKFARQQRLCRGEPYSNVHPYRDSPALKCLPLKWICLLPLTFHCKPQRRMVKYSYHYWE